MMSRLRSRRTRGRSSLRLLPIVQAVAGERIGKVLLVSFLLLLAGAGYQLVFGSKADLNDQMPSSIPSDCSRDVTRDINEWIASSPNGKSPSAIRTLSFSVEGAPKRCYRVDGEVFVPDRQHIALEGYGATRIDGSLGFLADDDPSATCEGTHGLAHDCKLKRSHFHLHNGIDLSVRGFEVVGLNKGSGLTFNPETEGQLGFRVEGTQGVRILGNTAYDIWGDYVGFQWGGSATGSPSRTAQPVRDGVVQDNNFNDECGRQGIGVVSAERISIVDNVIGGCSNAIDLEDETTYWPVRDILIRGNDIYDVWHGFVGNGQAENECNADRAIRIENNVMHMANHSSWPPIYSAGREKCHGAGVTVQGNVLRVREHGRDGDRGIVCEYIDRCEIRENRIIYEPDTPNAVPDQPPIKLAGGSHVVIARNDLHEWETLYDKDGKIHEPGVLACGNRLSPSSAFDSSNPVSLSPGYSPEQAPRPC